jgi:membrane-anchored protein YejM (alkaline phosphatase superfamily)
MIEHSRKSVFRWMGWFAIANSVVLAAVGLRYFQGFTPGTTVLSWIYLLTVYPAHHVLVSVIPLFTVLTPVVLLRPSRRLATVVAVTGLAKLVVCRPDSLDCIVF